LVETQVSTIEAAFEEFTERNDIAILLINQHVCITPLLLAVFRCVAMHTVADWLSLTHLLFHIMQIAEKIRSTVDKYQKAFPALLEIPSKDHPYGMSWVAVLFQSLTHWFSVSCIILLCRNTDPNKDSVLKRVQKLFGE
jgi:vacuolar-type H+-ATPase subunit F/Vma7